MLQHPLALEIQNRIDDVLERLRAGNAAAFGDVADREHSGLCFLREAHKTRGALPYLADISGRAFEIRSEDRLNGIDYYRIELLRARSGDDRFEQSFVQERHVFRGCMQTLGSELYLQRGFFARDVERRVTQLL